MGADPHCRPRCLGVLAAGVVLIGALLGTLGARAESLLITWTAPGDDGVVGQASSYELRYSQSGVTGADTASWWSDATSVSGMPAPGPSGSRESFLVTGLEPGRQYYFVLRTADEVPNVSGFSNISVRQTSTGGSTLATAAEFTARTAADGVALSWQPVTTGTAVGYRLYRSVLPDTSRSLLATLPLPDAAYSDTTAAEGITYEYALATFDGSGEGTPALATITVSTTHLAESPPFHGYPNPARGQVTIRFDVRAPEGGQVRLVVFDLTGRRICTLHDGPLPAGSHSIEWRCRSDQGTAVAPGVYNLILDAPDGRNRSQIALLP